MLEPRDRFVEANRLRLHLLEWGEGDRVVLLLHGFLEHAHGWDFLAPALVDAGYRVFALDWRGQGDSEWIGRGGYYHFFDYIADLAALVPQLAERVALVGHSMGANAALLYAGTEPQRVSALALVEGIGLPDNDPNDAPERVAGWLAELQRVAKRSRTGALSVEVAAERMSRNFPTLPREAALHLARHNLRESDGVVVWKFDPLHQTRSPQLSYVAQARAFWRRVDCPVLYVAGRDSGLRLSDEDLSERLEILRASRISIAGAGHHPHLEQPVELARLLVDFFAGAR